jgi:uncharacterized membrane protein YgcG
MKIVEDNANKTIRIDKRFSISIIFAFVIFMISGSAATMSYAAPQTLPSCTDPTGQNLRCMMVISTLPPPPNALQCQETSGQLLPCSYATQNLSNGEQIVAITVYVPASYLFTGYGPWTIVKKVVHETETTKTTTKIVCPDGQILNHTSHKCIDLKRPPPPPCERADSSAITDLDKNLKTKDCDTHDANEHGMTPSPPSTCKDNTTCPYVNTTSAHLAAIQPTNTSIPASGGSGAGSICVNNCTLGIAPPVDCTKNPNDPSCKQTLTPSTTTPPPSTSPSTKTCPDGSVIDASASCPTQSPPSATSPPPATGGGQGSPDNNPSPSPSPPSGGSGGDNGGSSSGSGGSSSGSGGSGGSSTSP